MVFRQMFWSNFGFRFFFFFVFFIFLKQYEWCDFCLLFQSRAQSMINMRVIYIWGISNCMCSHFSSVHIAKIFQKYPAHNSHQMPVSFTPDKLQKNYTNNIVYIHCWHLWYRLGLYVAHRSNVVGTRSLVARHAEK